MNELDSLPIVQAKDCRAGRDNDGLHKRRGVWYYCLIIDGKRRFFSTKTRNYQEARKERAKAIKAQQENRLPTDVAKLPFEKLLAQVLEDRRLHGSKLRGRRGAKRRVPLSEILSGLRKNALFPFCAISPGGVYARSTPPRLRITSISVRKK